MALLSSAAAVGTHKMEGEFDGGWWWARRRWKRRKDQKKENRGKGNEGKSWREKREISLPRVERRERRERTESCRTPNKAADHSRSDPGHKLLTSQNPQRPFLCARIEDIDRFFRRRRQRQRRCMKEDGGERSVDPRRGVALPIFSHPFRVDRSKD
jgi:hypothetical protein